MPSQEQIASDLTAKWGGDIQRVVHQLNELIGRALSQGDFLAYGFITQCVAAVMLESCAIAKELQSVRGQHGETLH